VDDVSKISDLIREEAAAAERAEVESDTHDHRLPEGTKVTRGHGRGRTLQIRLNEHEYAELEYFAKTRELPVSTVARGLLLGSLTPGDTTQELIRRLEQDLVALRQRLGES
jgi:hypothetical protein